MSPVLPNAHPGRTTSLTPNPFAPPYPEKTVTLPRHPFPALPHPTPRTSHLFPTAAPFLPTNPPQSRNFDSPLEWCAHPCYPRPREGPTPRPGNPAPKRGEAPGIRRGVENWTPATGHSPPTRPLSSSVTRCHSCVPKTRAGSYRFAQDRRCPQLRGAQNVAETDRFFDSRFRGDPRSRAHLVI